MFLKAFFRALTRNFGKMSFLKTLEKWVRLLPTHLGSTGRYVCCGVVSLFLGSKGEAPKASAISRYLKPENS